MAIELKSKEEKADDRLKIYNNAVKLLELLNVFIPMIGDIGVSIPVGLCQNVSDIAFEIGADVAMNSDYLELEKTLKAEYEDEIEGYTPWGY